MRLIAVRSKQRLNSLLDRIGAVWSELANELLSLKTGQ